MSKQWHNTLGTEQDWHYMEDGLVLQRYKSGRQYGANSSPVHLAVKQFATFAGVKRSVTFWQQTHDVHLFYTGIQVLVPKWGKFLNANGDYMEVWSSPSVPYVPYKQGSQDKVPSVMFVTPILRLPCMWHNKVNYLNFIIKIQTFILN
jgi:hypothetical protein